MNYKESLERIAINTENINETLNAICSIMELINKKLDE